jgi:hypothetical protein
VLALLPVSPTQALRSNVSIDPCAGHHVSASQFQKFADSVWHLPDWEKRAPKAKTIAALHLKLSCARGPGHRKAMKHRWRVDQRAFYQHRSAMLWRVRVTPFYGGGRWWAVPYYIVVCESGARGYVPSGYYGILFTAEVPTWQTWGEPGFAPSPGQASKPEQDIVAHRLWVAYGGEPWECA